MSCQDVVYGAALVDAGDPHVESLELVRQLAIINSHAVQNCCVQLMDVDRVFSDVITEVVRFAVNDAGFDSSARPSRS